MANIELNLVERGSGDPVIVLIHGFTCDLSDWSEQLSGLSGSYRCVALDLPGHGASAISEEASIESLAAAANNTLDIVELNDVIVVGHSMGCRIVSEMFSQSPGRVRGIVYVDGSRVASGDVEAAVKQNIETIERIGMAQFVEQLYAGFVVDGKPVAVRDFLTAKLPKINLDFAEKLWPNVVRWDASRSPAVLASINVPVLVIQSTSLDVDLNRVSLKPGQISPWMDEVTKAVPDTTAVIVPGVGHFPMLEAPLQTNDAILSFVRRLSESTVAAESS